MATHPTPPSSWVKSFRPRSFITKGGHKVADLVSNDHVDVRLVRTETVYDVIDKATGHVWREGLRYHSGRFHVGKESFKYLADAAAYIVAKMVSQASKP